ncbi:O-antigen ligase family protein, partial [Streptomyces nigra]
MTSAAGPDEDSDRRNVSDATGVVVLGACAAWSLISAAVHGGRPEGVLLAVLAVAAGYAVGRISGALLPVAAPCAGALAGVTLTLAVPRLAPGPQLVDRAARAGLGRAVCGPARGGPRVRPRRRRLRD